MLDTVRLRSPALDPATAWSVEQACERRITYQVATEVVTREITTGLLEGSFDHRVSVRVLREELRYYEELERPLWVECEPYVLLEGSVHKAMLGHNVRGGPLDPVAACRWFVADVSRRIADCSEGGCLTLPDGGRWSVQRLDWSEVYDLGSFAAVDEFLYSLRLAPMPRRKPMTYPGGVYYPGRTTTVKLYHKGPEYAKHDKRRWSAHAGIEAAQELLEEAHSLLRFETELHARKLTDDYKEDTGSTTGKPPVDWVTRSYLESVHDREAARLLREGASDMQTVRTNRAVSKRLKDVYGQTLGNVLFGTWLQLSALGEEVVKRELPKPTYYRHRKQLSDAGVSWHGADVRIIAQSAIPEGFSPIRADPRRLTVEDVRVQECLAPFRVAA